MSCYVMLSTCPDTVPNTFRLGRLALPWSKVLVVMGLKPELGWERRPESRLLELPKEREEPTGTLATSSDTAPALPRGLVMTPDTGEP